MGAPERFSTEVVVRFAETDAQGIVHHAVYLVWMELARVEYLGRFDGGYPGLQAAGIEALTLETYVRHVASARFGDRVRIGARCSEVRGARFRFDYALDVAGRTIADGWTTHACVDATTLRPTRVPAWLAGAIREAEG